MDILSHINWVDVLIVIICIRISYVSFRDGLSHEIFPLIGAIVTLVLTMHYYKCLSLVLSGSMAHLPVEISNFISFTVLALGLGFIFKIIRSVLDKIIKVTWHPVLDRFGGLIFGLVRSVIVVGIVLAIIVLMPVPYLQRSVKDKSLIGGHFLKSALLIYNKASKYLPISQTGTYK